MSWRPALKVRVPVTGRIWMVTVTGSSLTATTPVGSASPVGTVSSAETLVSVPGHEDDEWFDGDRFDLESRRRAAGDDRVDGQRPALAVREDGDDHVRRGWRDVDRADCVAELVDRKS